MGNEKKFLPAVATFTGVIAMVPQINNLIKVESFDKYSTATSVLSAFSALLWLINDWSNASWVVLVGLLVGFLIQVYILYGILSTRGFVGRPAFRRETTDRLSGYTI